MNIQNRLAILSVAAFVPAAAAQFQPHLTDFQLRLDADDRIETGLFEPDGTLVWDRRVNTGLMAGDVNFVNDPGFENTPGTLPVGYGLGISIRKALREWDGLSFDGIAPEPLILVKFFDQIPTPADDTLTPAFPFGAANSEGYFHHHIGFAFDAADPIEGLFLLEFELWSGDSSNVVTDPLFIVFAQGSDALLELDTALNWVENNLVAEPCLADLAAPAGVIDLADIDAFISAFLTGGTAADLAAPFGVIDLADIDTFIGAFLAGCP
ncbi:MAG: GC-type dockerin domain-anchored protein [Planctomycetota bacterium]